MLYRLKILAASSPEPKLVEVDASDPAAAQAQLERSGHIVLRVTRMRTLLSWPSARSRFPLLNFSQELLTLLGAGFTLNEALSTLAQRRSGGEARRLLGDLARTVQEGHRFSEALAQSPSIFPSLYTATIRVSERTGDISAALRKYIDYQRTMDEVKNKLITASLYPGILLSASVLVILFLLSYVVPKFSLIYQDMDTQLPWMSRALLEWGEIMAAHRLAVATVLAAGIGGMVWALTQGRIRRRVMQFVWSIPAIGEKLRLYELARLYRTLGMLLRSGTPFVEGLGMVKPLLSPAVRQSLEAAATSVASGVSIAQALGEHDLAEDIALRMLQVGERAGNLAEMFDQIAAYYDVELSRWTEWLTKLFAPLLMAGIGLLIGAVLVLMYLPIFELAEGIG